MEYIPSYSFLFLSVFAILFPAAAAAQYFDIIFDNSRKEKPMPAYNKTQSQAKLHNFLFEPNICIAALATLKGDLTAEKMSQAFLPSAIK